MKETTWTALLSVLLWATPGIAAAEWRRLDSPNFIVIGDAGERELRNIAVQFEGFRETLGRILSRKVTATAVPTVVVVFPHDRAYAPYKPVYNGKPVDVGGVFYSGRDVNYITLLSDVSEERLRVIFHEYAHLMVSNVVLNLPTWLSEGLAEYYSTYSYARDGREALIGRTVESHVLRLREGRLLPMSELIAVDHDSPLYNEGERRSVFYAQSWAVTHMLLHGGPERLAAVSTFMGAIQKGLSPADAWRQAFAGADIDRELQQYIRGFTFKAYRFKFDEAIARVNAAARTMPQPEVSAFLAGLRIRQERVADAVTLVEGALKSEAAHAHANVAKAQVDLENENRAAAVARLQSIGATDDWFVSYAAGTTLTSSVEGEKDVPAERLDAARAHFAAAAKGREMPNSLAALARLDLAGRKWTAETRRNIEKARELAPGRDDYVIIHAHVLTELGDFALARAVLAPMLTGAVPPHMRSNATSLMEYIQRVEMFQRPSTRETPPAAAGRALENAASTTSDTDAVKPAFRELQVGEQRLEGRLEAISCSAKGGVTFQVRSSSAGKEIFHAAEFNAVEFISFRDDLSGNITCGPLKEPARVYVTWRPGASTVRTAVAVEFLPKSSEPSRRQLIVSVATVSGATRKVRATGPTRISSPARSASAPLTRCPETNVPFLLPMSSTWAPSRVTRIRAWCRETPPCSSERWTAARRAS